MTLGGLPPLGPELRIFHIGGYWRRENDTVRQMMIGLRQGGARVFEFSTDQHRGALEADGRRYDRGTTAPVWLREEIVAPAIEEFDPQLIVCNAGGVSFREEFAARLRSSRRLLGIALSDPAVFEPTTSRIAPLFDLFLTNHPPTVPRYRALGANARALRFGTNPEFFRPVPPRPELGCEVLVIGHAHPDRIDPVRRLADAFDLHLYGEGWEHHGIPARGQIYGADSLAALASAASVVVFNRGLAGDPLIKPSLFDFTAAGALVVTNRYRAVEHYFRYGAEIVGFTDDLDLISQIHRVLSDPERAARIRHAGRARTLRDHRWAAAWSEMLEAQMGPGRADREGAA